MNNYIKDWKAEHLAIKDALASAIKIDICSKEGLEKMREAKRLILRHLKSEDEILYPMLKKAARKNVDMIRVVELLAKEMDELAPKVLEFFKDYENDPMAFGLSSRFDGIIALINARVDKEESIFLKEYENII